MLHSIAYNLLLGMIAFQLSILYQTYRSNIFILYYQLECVFLFFHLLKYPFVLFNLFVS